MSDDGFNMVGCGPEQVRLIPSRDTRFYIPIERVAQSIHDAGDRMEQCPYCAVNLPDYRDCDRHMFIHTIPKTSFRADCAANGLRESQARRR